MKNREFRLARQGANCHVGLGHGSGESDKLYSSPKMGVTDVTVGVTATSRLHRSYCCSRIPLLFCCYCSTLQHCSVPNVNKALVPYMHGHVQTFDFPRALRTAKRPLVFFIYIHTSHDTSGTVRTYTSPRTRGQGLSGSVMYAPSKAKRYPSRM